MHWLLASAFILCAIFCIGYTDNVISNECSESKGCTITGLTVTPCPVQSLQGDNPPLPLFCKIKRDNFADIQFNYTPQFASANLSTRAYWVTGTGELPFLDMEIDGCKRTTCPTVPNKEQPYAYRIKIRKLYPKGTYSLKWKLWGKDATNEMCCTTFRIKIV